MLLGLLVYGYATGVFSSRKLERATYGSVAFRFIAANDHPDHDTIATFNRASRSAPLRFAPSGDSPLRAALLRKRGYVPIVFNFDKPETKDFTETVRLLAGLLKFVIADITNPKSAARHLNCRRRSLRLGPVPTPAPPAL